VTAVVALWGALASAFSAVVAWIAGALAWVVGGVVTVVLGALTFLVALLPAAPSPDHSSVGALEQLATVNQYVPVVEALGLLGVWAALFGGVGLYKLVKFLRGAG
jgi:hypothetical protein